MKNFKNLFKYEFERQIHTYKFILLVVFSSFSTLICVYTQTKDYINKKEIYNNELINAEKLKNTFRVYADLEIPILIAPNPISIFAKGAEDIAGNKINVSITEIPVLEVTTQKRNPFLNVFSTFDILTIVKIIFSLFAILMVADVIVQEKEDKLLESIFTFQVTKTEYFLSKFSANLLTLLVPLLFIFVITLIYILFTNEIIIDKFDVLKIILIFLSCFIYIAIFILIGLILSLICKSSSNAIMAGLLIWISTVFVYPAIIESSAKKLIKIPNRNLISKQKEIISYELEQTFMNNLYESIDWSISGRRMNLYFIAYEETRYKGLPRFICVLQKYLMDGFIDALKEDIPALMDAQKRIESVNNEVVKQQIKQKKFISYFLCFVPANLLEESSTIIAGTDYFNRKLSVEIATREYRSRVLKFLENKGAFGYRFFTWLDAKEMHNFTEDYSKQDINNLVNESNTIRLKVSDIPEFKSNKENILPPELGILTLIAIVLLGINIRLINRIKLFE